MMAEQDEAAPRAAPHQNLAQAVTLLRHAEAMLTFGPGLGPGGASTLSVLDHDRSAMGRTLPLDFSPANGRNRCSPLIDRRHAKVWILMSQPPWTQSRSRPREQFRPKL
jgi:hypothetical protein